MKKISIISLICGIVLILAAIVLNAIGFSYINGMHVVRHMGYGFMEMSYYTNTSMTGTCLAMIIAGGFLFNGGILLLMLSAITKCRDHKCCKKEEVEKEAPVQIEQCHCIEQDNPEEQNQ